jgi:hypothetical protein
VNPPCQFSRLVDHHWPELSRAEGAGIEPASALRRYGLATRRITTLPTLQYVMLARTRRCWFRDGATRTLLALPRSPWECAVGRSRTCDTSFRKRALYPLSYDGSMRRNLFRFRYNPKQIKDITTAEQIRHPLVQVLAASERLKANRYPFTKNRILGFSIFLTASVPPGCER